MTEHELRDLVSRTLRMKNPAHELRVAAMLIEDGKVGSGRAITEHALELLNGRDVESALRRRA